MNLNNDNFQIETLEITNKWKQELKLKLEQRKKKSNSFSTFSIGLFLVILLNISLITYLFTSQNANPRSEQLKLVSQDFLVSSEK